MAEPAVSVILPAWNSHETVPACLDSLRAQTLGGFEVILVDSSPGAETEEIVRERYPEVRYIHSSRRLLPHAARNLGCTLARGAILAFTDPDCRMSSEWLERLVRAHREGHEAAGGAVASLGGGWFEQGVHITKYAWWLPGGKAGPRPDLPSANASYSRALFNTIGPFPEDWCGDTLLNRRATAQGIEFWFDPQAVVFHDHRTTLLRFLRERYARGYDYGRVRPRLERWSRLRTLAYAVAAPAIVFWLTWRAMRYVTAAHHLTLLLACFPVVMLGHTARSAGEAAAHWRTAWRRS